MDLRVQLALMNAALLIYEWQMVYSFLIHFIYVCVNVRTASLARTTLHTGEYKLLNNICSYFKNLKSLI